MVVQQPPATRPAAPVATTARERRTGLATASLVLGLAAMVLNLLLVPTVLAIVFGSLALGRGTAARARSIAGIVLGGAGVLALFLQIAILVPVLAAATHVPFHLQMASTIQHDVNAEGGMVLSHVVCPVAGRLYVGKQITCTADRAGVGPIRIDVTFTSAFGAYTYVTDSTPVG